MAAIDDLLRAVAALDATTAATGGVTHTLLQAVVNNTAATVAALQKKQPPTGQPGPAPSPVPNPTPGGQNPTPNPKPKKPPKGFFGTLWGRLRGGLKSTRGGRAAFGLGKAFGKLGRGLKGMFGGAGGAGGKAGAAGAVASAAVDLGKSLYEAGKAVKEFAYEQEAAARRLAQVSPSQAANLAQLDANRMLRDFETGENTAGSGKNLTDALDRWEEAVRPLEEALQDFKNGLGAALLEGLTVLVEAVNGLARLMPGYALAAKLREAEKEAEAGRREESGVMFGDFLEKTAEAHRKRAAVARARIAAVKRPPNQ